MMLRRMTRMVRRIKPVVKVKLIIKIMMMMLRMNKLLLKLKVCLLSMGLFSHFNIISYIEKSKKSKPSADDEWMAEVAASKGE
jgi:hypothetical protein